MNVLLAILSHQRPDEVAATIDRWVRAGFDPGDILLVYGGPREGYEHLTHEKKAFVEDSRLRCAEPRKNLQSYTEVFRHIAGQFGSHTHVLFVEYDVWPLASREDILNCYRQRLEAGDADVLCPLVLEVQDSCQVMFLQHRKIPGFRDFWQRLSVRDDNAVILWTLLPGSFWARSCIEAVASTQENPRQYFEIYLPTLVHHFGYRVRPIGDKRICIQGGGNLRNRIVHLRETGTILVHPIKSERRRRFWTG